jgi:murein DD-endopeptidase MepM/ murein hydrolase activator NlpD
VRTVLLLALAACAVKDPEASYRLPWQAQHVWLTQDCSEGDHAGASELAYDWASSDGAFTVVAARGGRITHLKISSTTGCDDPSCIDDANVLVIDHGDGTQATYLHLAGSSLAPGLACGAIVRRGQPLAIAGSTGWSSGTHLHFQVGATRSVSTCECGADGLQCRSDTMPWRAFWTQTQPISFDQWPDAASCAQRRMWMP